MWREISFAYKNSSIVIQSNVPECEILGADQRWSERRGQVGTQTSFYAHDLCCQNVEWILKLNTSEQSCRYFVAMQILIDVAVTHVMWLLVSSTGMKMSWTHSTLLIKSKSIEAETHPPQTNIVSWCSLIPASLLSLEILILAKEAPVSSSQCLPGKLRGPRGDYGWPEY